MSNWTVTSLGYHPSPAEFGLPEADPLLSEGVGFLLIEGGIGAHLTRAGSAEMVLRLSVADERVTVEEALEELPFVAVGWPADWTEAPAWKNGGHVTEVGAEP
jgi:hypothetical protein